MYDRVDGDIEGIPIGSRTVILGGNVKYDRVDGDIEGITIGCRPVVLRCNV